jgi:isoleucyl-tRNA synthetase
MQAHKKQEIETFEFWTDKKIFEKTLEKNIHQEFFNFAEGPPFCTGDPHYGHILGGFIKDSITRYQYSLGKNVPRQSGFDTHGLPIEYEIEKELHIKTTDEILAFGIDNYNEACRNIVMRCSDTWEKTMGRLGRWMDYKNCYKTCDKNYMNSIWWTFKQLFNKNRVYQGVKIMPFSTTCGTALSNFETQQNYQEVQDDSLYICLPIVYKNYIASIMVWTTTPWTLASNYALCVNSNIQYSLVLSDKLLKILATNLIESVFKTKKLTIVTNFMGSELVGLKYVAPFNYVNSEYKIISDDYVSESDGTGIVHIAPSYGEDDYRICLLNNIITKETKLFQPLDINGFISENIIECKGLFYKNHKLSDKSKQDFNTWIIIKLKEKNMYFDKRQITHNYPFCWRSNTPLIYKAVSSWFVKVEDMQDKLVELNKNINWIPNNIGSGRFNNWLANARDWSISRSRFWGTPIPIWVAEDGDIICVESSYELEQLVGLPENSITDLHRHHIDKLEINISGKVYRRINDIFDCWYESGSMPYATLGGCGIVELLRQSVDGIQHNGIQHNGIQHNGINHNGINHNGINHNGINHNGIQHNGIQHNGIQHNGINHFIKTDKIYNILPADFIAEGIDQTRGWFYTLMVLSVSLFDMIPFKNVIVNGLILAQDGKKMSKSLKNYPDPMTIVNEYSSDALRLYLLSSSAVRGETLKFNKSGVHDVMKDIIIPLTNTIVFWKEYYTLYWEKYGMDGLIDLTVSMLVNPINIWILIEYEKIRNNFYRYMSEYNLMDAIQCLYKLTEIINNGYIKLARSSFKNEHANESLNTLYYIIKFIISDFKVVMPFFCEKEYLNLKNFIKHSDSYFDNESIHLCNTHKYIDLTDQEANDFNIIYTIICNVHKLRGSINLSLKKPVKSITIVIDNILEEKYTNKYRQYLHFISNECNVLDIYIKTHEEIAISKNIKPVRSFFFKQYGKEISDEFAKLEKMSSNELNTIIENNTFCSSLFNINYNIESEDMTRIILKEFNFESSKIIVLLDKQYDESIDKIYYYRLVAANIQKNRKLAGLHPWDQIKVMYKYINKKYDLNSSDAIAYIQNIIKVNSFEEYNSKNTPDIFYENNIEEVNITIYFIKL